MAEGVQVGGSAGRDEESDGEGGTRRDFLYLATAAVAAYGVASVIWPLIDQMNPAADVLALASVDVDLSPIELGQRVTVTWRGKPVFIDHRTKERIDEARSVDVNNLRDPQTDEERVKKAEWLVMVGICTHLGCIPLGQKPTDDRGPYGGWFCPCHGSIYDTSGRIRQGPAPRNLEVPDYEFTESTAIRIG